MADDNRELGDILRTLTEEQLKFVGERLSCRTDAEAADRCGLPQRTVYGWDNKQDVNEAVRLARMDGLNVARERLRRMVGRALDVLDTEMDGKRRNSRPLDSAKEVLDRAGLVVVQKTEISGRDGGPIEHDVRGEMVDRMLAKVYGDNSDSGARALPEGGA